MENKENQGKLTHLVKIRSNEKHKSLKVTQGYDLNSF